MSVTEDLSELADKVEGAVRDAIKIPGTDAVRMALNDAGIVRARTLLESRLVELEATQTDYRKAQTAERDAKEALASAESEAEWELDGRFVSEGNKTFLVTGEDRKAMTADERAKWKSIEARKVPAVAKAAEVLRKAEALTADRRDAVTIADKSLSAARADLDAAIATLNAWTAVLPRRVA